MSFRVEHHLNVPIKGRMKGLSYDQAVKYGLFHDINNPKSNIASVKQEGSKLIIIKRIDTKHSWFFKQGLPQKGFFERITVDQKDKSVAIDSFEHHWNVETGPYVWRRDLFMTRDDEPNKLIFVRHLLWVSQLKRMQAHLMSGFNTWRLKSKINKY